MDFEVIFGKSYSQLSEIFWEGVEETMNKRLYFLTSCMSNSSIGARALKYAEAVKWKSRALKICVGFIYGTFTGIARLSGGNVKQMFSYNGHKCNHSFKYQAVTSKVEFRRWNDS